MVRASYDALQFFPSATAPAGLSVITLEPPSDRAAQAALIDYLTKDGARLIVWDILLAEPKDPVQDDALAHALRRSERVLLAAEHDALIRREGVSRARTTLPVDRFLTNALDWGYAGVEQDADGVVRWIWQGTDLKESLPVIAARRAGGLRAGQRGVAAASPRAWIRYYGPPPTLPHYTFEEATQQLPRHFQGQVVFVGRRSQTGESGEVKDTFATPYSGRTGEWMGGVELLAVSYANLLLDRWMARLPWWGELGVCILSGWMILRCFMAAKAWALIWILPLTTVVILAVAVVVSVGLDLWFPWMVLTISQIPLAWLGTFHRRGLEAVRSGQLPKKPWTEVAAVRGPGLLPPIPDHQLLRVVGRGGYGEVWIAQNRVGLFHAVKITYRDRFGSDEPYEREFRGIQRFMPISRLHQGLVHLLHVGRDDRQGFFFCILELADDERTPESLNPDDYQPRTLAGMISRSGKLPPAEVLELMVALSEAVGFLHAQGLVHRDIKPSNIIFVRGQPKLADVGLVAPTSQGVDQPSLVGTAGYLLREAPGTVEADLYALGKVLYVALTGLEPERFPETSAPQTGLDSAVVGFTSELLANELMEVAWRACAVQSEGCYRSAADLRTDLLSLRTHASNPSVAKPPLGH